MAFRAMCRKQRNISNCISSHCLSTTVPPPGFTAAKTSVKNSGRQTINGVLPSSVNRFALRGVTDPIQAFRDASRRASNRRDTHVMARAESQPIPEEHTDNNTDRSQKIIFPNKGTDCQHDVNAFYRQATTDFPVTPSR